MVSHLRWRNGKIHDRRRKKRTVHEDSEDSDEEVLENQKKRSNIETPQKKEDGAVAQAIVDSASIKKVLKIPPDALERGEFLGQGTQASVFRGRFGQVDVALKVFTVSSKRLAAQIEQQLLQEKEVHSKLIHNHVVTLYAISVQGQHLTMVTELMHSSLGTEMDKDVPFATITQAVICRDVAMGLSYLHSRNIVHGDIKPMNILLSEDHLTAKVCDFALSRYKERLGATKTKTLQGTFTYMAPEMLSPTKCERCGFNGYKWALSATICELVTSEDFWDIELLEDETVLDKLQQFVQEKVTPHGMKRLKEKHRKFHAIAGKLCRYDPSERGSLKDTIALCDEIRQLEVNSEPKNTSNPISKK